MQKTLCATLALGGLLMAGSDAALAQAAAGTVVLNGAAGNTCSYTAINVQPDGGISVTCSGGAATVPGKPGSVTATPYDAKISVAYTAAAANGSAITQYEATCDSVDSPTVSQTGAGSATSILVTGAVNTKTYTCRVRATNGVGTGDYSDPSAAVTPQAGLDPTAPAKPAAPTATAGSGSVALAFTAPANGGAAITGYSASCTSSDGGNAGTASTTNGGATSLTVTGLTGGKTYTCTVSATNSMGTSPASDPSSAVIVAAGCGAIPDGVTLATWTNYKNPGNTMETGTLTTGKSKAFGFVADQTFYPIGNQVQLETSTQTGGSNRVDVAISTCPGDFTNVLPRCGLTNVKLYTMNTTFNSAETTACLLTNGQQYYLNIRPNALYPNAAKVFGAQAR